MSRATLLSIYPLVSVPVQFEKQGCEGKDHGLEHESGIDVRIVVYASNYNMVC